MAITLTSAVALAHYKAGPFRIDHPWTHATPAGAKVAGGYLTLQNSGTAPDRLIGVRSEIAARVEIHEIGMKDGVMTMQPLDQGLEVNPGATVELS